MSNVVFGAMSPPLSEQIPGHDWTLEQKLADAITLLAIRQLLTQTETSKARTRLIKIMNQKLRKG